MDAAGDRIRKGHIQFIGGDILAFVQDLDGALVAFAAVAKHVGEHHDIFHLAKFGQLFVEKGARANVLQPNRVEHAGGGFIQTRRRIAGHRLGGESFDHKSAKFAEVHDVFELDAVAKSPAGSDHRILQLYAGEADTEIKTGSRSG